MSRLKALKETHPLYIGLQEQLRDRSVVTKFEGVFLEVAETDYLRIYGFYYYEEYTVWVYGDVWKNTVPIGDSLKCQITKHLPINSELEYVFSNLPIKTLTEFLFSKDCVMREYASRVLKQKGKKKV